MKVSDRTVTLLIVILIPLWMAVVYSFAFVGVLNTMVLPRENALREENRELQSQLTAARESQEIEARIIGRWSRVKDGTVYYLDLRYDHVATLLELSSAERNAPEEWKRDPRLTDAFRWHLVSANPKEAKILLTRQKIEINGGRPLSPNQKAASVSLSDQSVVISATWFPSEGTLVVNFADEPRTYRWN